MKKLLTLLFILSIISMQLWAAAPASPQSAAMAAAAAGSTVTASAAPAGFGPKERAAMAALFTPAAASATPAKGWQVSITPHEAKAFREPDTFKTVLAKLKKIAANDEFRLNNKGWTNEKEVHAKTNCNEITNLLLKRLLGIDTKDFKDEVRRGTAKAMKYQDLLTHPDILSDSKKSESKLFSIYIHDLNPKDQGILHRFLLFKIGLPTNTRYIILHSWKKSFTLAEWFNVDPISSTLEDPEPALYLHGKYNPAKKLRKEDVIDFLEDIRPLPPFHNNTPYFISTYDFPNPFDITPCTSELYAAKPAAPAKSATAAAAAACTFAESSATPAGTTDSPMSLLGTSVSPSAAAAGAASPSTIDPAKKCAHPDCQKEGNKTCARCKIKKYCSEDCQKKDWRIHKQSCIAPAKKA